VATHIFLRIYDSGQLDDFTHKRDASITKDHVILFTYKNVNAPSPGAVIDGALKGLTSSVIPVQLPRRL
jgi:hypothetical protein